MIKKIFNVIKRISISFFALYGFNLIAAPINLIIPINLVTIATLTILGVPSIFIFIIIYVLIF